MSNIKEVHGKLRLYVSFLEYGRHVGQLRRRRRAYAPTSNTASQDNHEKINSWVSFIFPLHDEYGAPLGGPSGRRSSAMNEQQHQNLSFHTGIRNNLLQCYKLKMIGVLATQNSVEVKMCGVLIGHLDSCALCD